MRPSLRHPFRLLSRLLVLKWAWRNRHDLLRWSRFAMRLPSEVRTRDFDDLVTEARARMVLSADPRTRLSGDVDICGYENGSLMVQAHGEKPVAQVARELLAGVSGVVDVRVVDPELPTSDSGPSPTERTATGSLS
ncbi:MAG: hypothetical protein ACRD2C_09810 [Acidimicrobiales bacterium]